ncbi:MAG: acylphosphatase [Lactobacillus sp.]|jgi:acylphosphatase|nr:acylphosphatase [Lactobacillus sp.]MCI2032203.1 acylphosphatase [Lactobacillus sp.]
MAEIAKSMRVTGRVQGVGFRWMTKMVADQLKITGYVQNRFDGSVYIEAKGEVLAMAKFAAAIKASPTPSGRVATYEEHVLTKDFPYDDFRVTG